MHIIKSNLICTHTMWLVCVLKNTGPDKNAIDAEIDLLYLIGKLNKMKVDITFILFVIINP